MILNMELSKEHMLATFGRNDSKLFFESGQKSLDQIKSLVKDKEIKDVLDWGCGLGRVLKFWGPEVHRHGCDINKEYLKLARKNCDNRGDFYACNSMPPTKYDDKSFDLIYGCSVLTHLDFESQKIWSKELKRILKPDGMAILTFDSRNFNRAMFRGKEDLIKDRYQTVHLFEDDFFLSHKRDGILWVIQSPGTIVLNFPQFKIEFHHGLKIFHGQQTAVFTLPK